jgi:hypothetical protein
MVHPVHEQLEEGETSLLNVLEGVISLLHLDQEGALRRLGENMEEPSATLNISFNAIGVDKYLVMGSVIKRNRFIPSEEVHDGLH